MAGGAKAPPYDSFTMAFIKLSDLVSREQIPGFYGQFIHGDSMTVVHWDVNAGAALPEHAHPHEQVSCLLDGEFEMTVGGATERLSSGAVAVVPSNAVHSGRAITDCRFIDIFQPVREDYK